MPKPRSKTAGPSVSAPRSSPQARRTPETEAAVGAGSRRPGERSDAVRLATEVAALQAELDAARAKVRELEVHADTDPLLELLNRRGFERELTRSLAYVKRYGADAALLYVDLDWFKAINDRHGHAAGDAMLKAIAVTLVRNVRASDVVARLGGDEFGVLLWNLTDAAAARKAAAIETAIGETKIKLGSVVVSVGASVGVAMLVAGDRPADILERADRSMYARKAIRGGAGILKRGGRAAGATR